MQHARRCMVAQALCRQASAGQQQNEFDSPINSHRMDSHCSSGSGLSAGLRGKSPPPQRPQRAPPLGDLPQCSRTALPVALRVLTSLQAALMALAAVQSATCFPGRPVGRRLPAAGRFAGVTAASASRVSCCGCDPSVLLQTRCGDGALLLPLAALQARAAQVMRGIRVQVRASAEERQCLRRPRRRPACALLHSMPGG